MSAIGEAYLALVIAAFLTFAGTVFWGMISTNALAQRPNDTRNERDW
jgi:hypothetical protein